MERKGGIFYLDSKTYFVSRDVSFFESEFPFVHVYETLIKLSQHVESDENEFESVMSEHLEKTTEQMITEVRGYQIGDYSRC